MPIQTTVVCALKVTSTVSQGKLRFRVAMLVSSGPQIPNGDLRLCEDSANYRTHAFNLYETKESDALTL